MRLQSAAVPLGEFEIGYGVAAPSRARGHATRAVAAMLAAAKSDATVSVFIAETAALKLLRSGSGRSERCHAGG